LQQETVPKCGREAVEYFAKCFHVGKIESMFFNVASGRHYQPYSLIEVPKDQVSLLELYLISSAKEVVVLPWTVDLSVSRLVKGYGTVFMKLFGRVNPGTFWVVLDLKQVPGIFLIFIVAKYVLDSIKYYILYILYISTTGHRYTKI